MWSWVRVSLGGYFFLLLLPLIQKNARGTACSLPLREGEGTGVRDFTSCAPPWAEIREGMTDSQTRASDEGTRGQSPPNAGCQGPESRPQPGQSCRGGWAVSEPRPWPPLPRQQEIAWPSSQPGPEAPASLRARFLYPVVLLRIHQVQPSPPLNFHPRPRSKVEQDGYVTF